MADFDLHIKGGTVVDGTRTPRYTADVWIRDGKIAQIGGRAPGFAKKVIDADGLVVAPGFVDLHTHYDAQIRWDPYCTISGWHGVTSVVLGNCGFGFAPVKPDFRERSMLTMTRTEACAAFPFSGSVGTLPRRTSTARPWSPTPCATRTSSTWPRYCACVATASSRSPR